MRLKLHPTGNWQLSVSFDGSSNPWLPSQGCEDCPQCPLPRFLFPLNAPSSHKRPFGGVFSRKRVFSQPCLDNFQ